MTGWWILLQSNMSSFFNSVPIVGHIKGIVHYARGDKEGGNKAMKSATRTTAVIAAGVTGEVVAGPMGAFAGGVGAGAEWDLIISALTGGKEVKGIAKIINNPKSVHSYVDAGLAVVSDGILGQAAGEKFEEMR